MVDIPNDQRGTDAGYRSLLDTRGTESRGLDGSILAQQNQNKRKENWFGNSIVLPKNVFEALRNKFGEEERRHLRFQGYKKLTIIGGVVGVEAGYGILQIDRNFDSKTNKFTWRLLNEIVSSGENVLVAFAVSGPVATNYREKETKKIRTLVNDTILTELGLTLASKVLQKKIYGDLVASNKKVGVHSPYETLSIAYLMGNVADPNTVVHELLGHVYLVTQAKPYGHDESLVDLGVKGPSGEIYQKTVWDFIKEVERLP